MYLTDILRETRQTLTRAGISEGEASALAFMLVEETTGLSKTQVLTTDTTGIDIATIRNCTQAIAGGTPIQYVLGYSNFCGLRLKVSPAVLIPRPETEELVRWAVETSSQPTSILDIGTGSGCIAIALAKAFPEATVTAVDISEAALAVARENAKSNDVNVAFCMLDILTRQPVGNAYDIIISNPPYICRSEARDMEANVLLHEPHTALFVPDDDPLLFYRAIARVATEKLAAGGFLYFEINRQFAAPLRTMLTSLGYGDIALRQDQFGNDRMIRATRPIGR